MKINYRLKELRKTLNLSQAEFGNRIGLKQGAVSKMEQAGSTIVEQNIKLICEKFSVNREWLTEGTGEMFYESDRLILNELSSQYKLTEEQFATLEAFLRLSSEERNIILKWVRNAAAGIETAKENEISAEQEKEIDAEVEAYRQELLARKRGETVSASGTGKEPIAN